MTKTAVDRFATLKAEFKDFDVSTLPALPEAWVDRSWHNDACPCFAIIEGDDYSAMLYVDYLSPDDREFPEALRYTITEFLDQGATNDVISTDDFSKIIEAAANLKASA